MATQVHEQAAGIRLPPLSEVIMLGGLLPRSDKDRFAAEFNAAMRQAMDEDDPQRVAVVLASWRREIMLRQDPEFWKMDDPKRWDEAEEMTVEELRAKVARLRKELSAE